MNPPCEDIKDMLEADSSLALEYKTNLFIALQPESPDYCVTVTDSGGFGGSLQYVLQRPSVQVRIRGEKFKYLNTYNKLSVIKNYLTSQSVGFGVTWNGTRYISIVELGDILFIGYDSNNRPLLSCNFVIERTE